MNNKKKKKLIFHLGYAYFSENFFSKYFLVDNLTNEKKVIISFIVKVRFSTKSDISSRENKKFE